MPPPNVPIRILGVDTSLRSTGVAVIEAQGVRLAPVEYTVIENPAGRPLSACLRHLQSELAEFLARLTPRMAAVEGIFFCQNVKTAVILGEARGVVLAACAAAGLPVHEYSPRRVKQAVVGFGGAGKDQVGQMVKSILGLRETPQEDAADALAIAICHANILGRRIPELLGKEI